MFVNGRADEVEDSDGHLHFQAGAPGPGTIGRAVKAGMSTSEMGSELKISMNHGCVVSSRVLPGNTGFAESMPKTSPRWTKTFLKIYYPS